MSYKMRILDINFIISLGYNVLEIEMAGESRFFLTNDFEPPNSGSVISANYITFRGRDMTEFIENSGFNQMNTSLYRENLERKITNMKETNFKFSDLHVWRFYTA